MNINFNTPISRTLKLVSLNVQKIEMRGYDDRIELHIIHKKHPGCMFILTFCSIFSLSPSRKGWYSLYARIRGQNISSALGTYIMRKNVHLPSLQKDSWKILLTNCIQNCLRSSKWPREYYRKRLEVFKDTWYE